MCVGRGFLTFGSALGTTSILRGSTTSHGTVVIGLLHACVAQDQSTNSGQTNCHGCAHVVVIRVFAVITCGKEHLLDGCQLDRFLG